MTQVRSLTCPSPLSSGRVCRPLLVEFLLLLPSSKIYQEPVTVANSQKTVYEWCDMHRMDSLRVFTDIAAAAPRYHTSAATVTVIPTAVAPPRAAEPVATLMAPQSQLQHYRKRWCPVWIYAPQRYGIQTKHSTRALRCGYY
jgi:hypothetical protein